MVEYTYSAVTPISDILRYTNLGVLFVELPLRFLPVLRTKSPILPILQLNCSISFRNHFPKFRFFRSYALEIRHSPIVRFFDFIILQDTSEVICRR